MKRVYTREAQKEIALGSETQINRAFHPNSFHRPNQLSNNEMNHTSRNANRKIQGEGNF